VEGREGGRAEGGKDVEREVWRLLGGWERWEGWIIGGEGAEGYMLRLEGDSLNDDIVREYI